MPKEPSSDIYDVSDREKERSRLRASKAAAADVDRDPFEKLGMNPDQARAMEELNHKKDQAYDKLINMSSTTQSGNDNLLDVESPAIEYSRREEETTLTHVQQPGSTRRSYRPRHTDASGIDLDDDLFDLDDTLEDSLRDEDDTASQTGAASGYRSADTSSFNVNLFKKRRPRQSSVAGKDDAPIRPSSRGANTPSISSTLNLGNFRRRKRQPSILSTGRKDRSVRAQSHVSRDEENDNGIEDDDSGPDGESTPLDLGKRRSGAAAAAAVNRDSLLQSSPIQAGSRKRKSVDANHSDGPSDKRAALEADLPPSPQQQNEQVHESIEINSDPPSELSSPVSSPPPTPPTLPPAHRRSPRASQLEQRQQSDRPSTPPQPADEEEDDPYNAPPASSDSSDAGSPVVWPSLNNLTHRAYGSRHRAPPPPASAALHTALASATIAAPFARLRTQTPEPRDDGGDNESDLSSPPSLTHSPNYGPSRSKPAGRPTSASKKSAAAAAAARKKEAAAAKIKAATTADLASLLPARRNRKTSGGSGKSKKDPFDIGSSDDDEEGSDDEGSITAREDGDELSYVGTAKERKRLEEKRQREKEKASAQKKKQQQQQALKEASATKNSTKISSKGKEKETAKPLSTRSRRTYSRSSDKENEGSDDSIVVGGGGGSDQEQDDDPFVEAETSQMMRERLGDELHNAKKKFQEVDQWELTYEEVTERSSSPARGGR